MACLLYNHGSYYGVFTKAGRKHWVRIGRVDKQNARKILRQLEVEYAKDRLNLTEEKPITLFEFLDKYLDYTKANKAQSTYKRELQILKHIREYFGNVFLRKITNHMVEGYKAERLKDDVTNSGVNRELAVVSHMLRKAVDWQYIKDSPYKGIRLLKKEINPVKFLSIEEMDKLYESASSWLKPILLVLRNTGVRLHELLNLRWKDLDFNRNCITVRSNKTNSYRVIPMNAELKDTLLYLKDWYINPRGITVSPRQDIQKLYLFCNPDGSKLKSIDPIRTPFKTMCRRTKIKASPHLYRHSFASHLVMAGESLASVKELLGHTQISTTMIYAHLSPQHIARAVENLPWIKPKPTDTE